MKNMIKNLKLAAALIVSVVAVNVSNAQQEVAAIGMQISDERSELLQSTFKAQFPDDAVAFTLGKSAIEQLLSTQGAQGLWIINAIDDKGNTTLVFRAADQNGELINSLTVTNPALAGQQLSSVASIGTSIDEKTANTWIQNFRLQKPERIYANMFGRNMLNEVLSPSNIEGIQFVFGADVDKSEHMVLLGVNADGFPDPPPYNSGVTCPPNCKGILTIESTFSMK